ncbi:MAG: carboxypeptidase regulatory-like domain-containing protein, partial [Polyangiaceae bacterium]|nr:carboxypeptidase regulatory-like domain-containing protein [Polyangiaceae bacterium]
YNELVSNGTISGPLETPLALPLAITTPAFPSFSAGTTAVTLAQREDRTLAAGSYGQVTLSAGTTADATVLTLTGGVYELAGLNVGPRSRIECAAGCELRVKGRLEPGENAYLGPAAGAAIGPEDVEIFVEGQNGSTGNLGATPKAAVIGIDNTVHARIFVPNGTLWLKDSTTGTGTFVARDVEVGIGVVLDKDVVAEPDCADACEKMLAAACTEGPATEADCRESCATFLAATDCAEQWGAVVLCANAASSASCDAEGEPTFAACATEEGAHADCVAICGSVDDGNLCTADTCDCPLAGCDPGTAATHTPVGAGTPCPDPDLCNGTETCDASGACSPGTPVATDDGNACTTDACDPTTGLATHTPVAADTSCADGDLCNGPEACDGAGSCVRGAAPVVDDDNPCTADACDPGYGVLHTSLPAGAPCSDGNACNGAESCDGALTCKAGHALASDDGNPCTADACDPALGVVHTPEATGTPCADADVCNGAEACDGAGTCAPGYALVADDGIECTIDACDPGTGAVTHAPCPVLDETVATLLYDASRFLYTGPDAVQFGLDPSVLDPPRVAVLRGLVLDASGSPLPGATIRLLGRDPAEPDYGYTRSHADGTFDFVTNGGPLVTVVYEKDGYLPAERSIATPWADYALLPDVVLLRPDATATVVDFSGSAPAQVARGSVSSDTDGTRQATVIVPAGTTASLVYPDGSETPASTLHLRLTEYTVGPLGPKAMPGELPPASAYTYAVEIGADEAVAAGATSVRLSAPAAFYVENFLSLPIGAHVPLGAFDLGRGEWLAEPDGRIVKVVGVSAGAAGLDLDGDGSADDATALAALGITDEERALVADLYPVGAELSRLSMPHFSTFDGNFAMVSDPDSPCGPLDPTCGDGDDDEPRPRDDNDDDDEPECGSIIECAGQA